MCGIVGFVDPSASEGAQRARLKGMLHLIHHRGPDGEGTHIEPALHVAMGMRRLSIIDIAGGDQPIWNEAKTKCVFFNGEIYNYVELRAELIALGHRFRTSSDTEVLVHAYEQYGSAMLNRLRGMFGLAILDLENRVLFLARDCFGQKPLYYAFEGNKFAFASELKSLLVLPWVSRELDETSFFDFVSWHSVPAPRTHFRSISKLAAGTFLEIRLPILSELAAQRFWRYPVKGGTPIESMDEAVDALDRVLDDSMRLHLRSDVPVGILLSGGLDSRVVAAYAAAASPNKLSTFSVGFEGVPDSEHIEAARTAKEIGTDHHTVFLKSADLADDIEAVAWHLDEPIGDPAAFAVLGLCRFARQHVKVLLGGEGSDELFAGYVGRYHGMMKTVSRTNSLRWLANVLPPPRTAYPTTAFGRLRQRVHSKRGAEVLSLRIEGFPGDVRGPRGLTVPQLDRLRRRQTELGDVFCPPDGEMLAEMTGVDVAWQLPDSLLLKSDKMSMAASIELRCPFLDPEVARLASRIASSLKISSDGVTGKMPLRLCLQRKLPEGLNRPKKGFPIPLATWIAGPLRQPVESVVKGSSSAWKQFLSPALVEQAWRQFVDGDRSLASCFYSLWLHDIWHRRLRSIAIDGESHACIESRN
jgi:asparagine synthase (glutamine-hydrolysing)